MKNKNKTILKTAKIISYVFVPPVLNFLIFILYSIHYEIGIKILYSISISFLFGFSIPIITFLNFRRKGKIINDDATIKEERTIPYIYGIIFTFFGVVLSGIFELNEAIIMLWMIYLICSIVIININRFWKISAHTMGAAIPLGAAFFFSYVSVFLGIIILISWSRFYLKVHTFTQIFAGTFIGFTISYMLLNLCL